MGVAAVSALRASVRFYGELNDFLPEANRQADIQCTLTEPTTVKDLVERLGVPHTEVDLVLVDGESVDFRHVFADGARVAVYPAFHVLDIADVTKVRPAPLGEPRFVVDGHLGKLASHLRLLGFDTVYANDAEDSWLAGVSAAEGRILLTRDRRLLKRSVVERGYCVREDDPRRQLLEVVRRFELAARARPFTRCVRCNGSLVAVTKADVLDRLEPKTKLYYDDFRQCDGCGRVYWKGSHYEALSALVEMAS
jgi:uncharacterized protein with PIN domain/sulfur carrier protein ThiS